MADTKESRPSHESSPPAVEGAPIDRAESLLAAGSGTADDRAKDEVHDLEYGRADGPSKPAEVDAVRKREELRRDPKNASATDAKVDEALEEKAIEEGVEAANETARIVGDLSHNI